MGVHKPWDRYFFAGEGSIMKEGSSTKLAKNQIGLFNMEKRDIFGVKAVDVSEIINSDKTNTKFELRQGIANSAGVTRTMSNKGRASMPFHLNDVVKAWVSTPTVTEQTFDEIYIGYDGFTPNSGFKFRPGENFTTEITLFGKAVPYLNYGGKFTARYSTVIEDVDAWDICNEQDYCSTVDPREETLKMVKYFREYLLPNEKKLTDYVTINPVFSAQGAVATTAHKVFQLDFAGFKGANMIGEVQAQYPDYKVVRDPLTEKFQILVPATVTPTAFKLKLSDVLPGCEGCPDGFTEQKGGFVYAIKSSGAEAPTIAGAVVTKTGEDKGEGVSYYIALAEARLEDSVLEAVKGEVIFVGVKGDVCINSAETTHAWVEVGQGKATTAKYSIVLSDDCNGTRLTELQAYYPELTIVEESTPAPANCIRKYSTTVMSDVQFDENCPNSTVIRDVYTTKAPENFEISSFWVEDVPVDATQNVECGIVIKGLPIILNSDDEGLRDNLPFIATSTRIQAVSGYAEDFYLNKPVLRSRFQVRKTSEAKDLDNLGGNLKIFERAGDAYFLNQTYMKDNLIGRKLLGTESQLYGLTQYNDYAFEINKLGHAQGLSGKANESIVYHIFAPVGKAKDVEQLHKAIAGASGVPITYTGRK